MQIPIIGSKASIKKTTIYLTELSIKKNSSRKNCYKPNILYLTTKKKFTANFF